MDISEVKKWAMYHGGHGASHIVTGYEQDEWTYTACGTMVTGATVADSPQGMVPSRICRRCREAMKDLIPVENQK